MYTLKEMRVANQPFVRYSGEDRCDKCCFEEPMCWKYKCSDEYGKFYYTSWPKTSKPSLVQRLKNILIGE